MRFERHLAQLHTVDRTRDTLLSVGESAMSYEQQVVLEAIDEA
jgi:hypothetical protein